MGRLLPIGLFIGFSFGLLGAFMAFLITYEEYSHHYQDKTKPRKLALQTSALAFFVFFILAIMVSLFFVAAR